MLPKSYRNPSINESTLHLYLIQHHHLWSNPLESVYIQCSQCLPNYGMLPWNPFFDLIFMLEKRKKSHRANQGYSKWGTTDIFFFTKTSCTIVVVAVHYHDEREPIFLYHFSRCFLFISSLNCLRKSQLKINELIRKNKLFVAQPTLQYQRNTSK